MRCGGAAGRDLVAGASAIEDAAVTTPTITKRRSTGKRLRFEVFKRDSFACQYCGAQPPDVVLVVDHIIPVAAGGDSDMMNLITACEPCNQGKSDKPLGVRQVRPDADLMFLEAQQEIAETKRYIAAIEERQAVQIRLIETLQQVWVEVSGLDWHPSEQLTRKLLSASDAATVEAAFVNVAPKVASGYVSRAGEAWVKYLWGFLRTTKKSDDATTFQVNEREWNALWDVATTFAAAWAASGVPAPEEIPDGLLLEGRLLARSSYECLLEQKKRDS